MDDLAKQHLMAMVDCERWEDMPPNLVDRCAVIETLIQKAKPYGGLKSTQTLALIVEQWKAAEAKRK